MTHDELAAWWGDPANREAHRVRCQAHIEAQEREAKQQAIRDLYEMIRAAPKDLSVMSADGVAILVYQAIELGSIRGVGIVNREEGE